MNIQGLMKLTLLDYPGHVAATVFLGGCNLRCPFCHNASVVGAKNESIERDELFAYLKKRKGILEGVCVTGGEPLINNDIEVLLSDIKELGYKVKLDTNGCYPNRLSGLISAGLVDYVAMDVKNSPEHYAETVGIDGFDVSVIKESIRIIMNSGVDYEFRTTVSKEFHNEERIRGAAKLIEGAKRYYLQNYVNSGDMIGDELTSFSPEEMENLRLSAAEMVEESHIRGE